MTSLLVKKVPIEAESYNFLGGVANVASSKCKFTCKKILFICAKEFTVWKVSLFETANKRGENGPKIFL